MKLGLSNRVLMEHPPKQGLKQERNESSETYRQWVLMEHPPKQGLKLFQCLIRGICVPLF